MKKRYQIGREKAVRRFERQAAGGDHEVQLHVPLKQIAAALQEGVGLVSTSEACCLVTIPDAPY